MYTRWKGYIYIPRQPPTPGLPGYMYVPGSRGWQPPTPGLLNAIYSLPGTEPSLSWTAVRLCDLLCRVEMKAMGPFPRDLVRPFCNAPPAQFGTNLQRAECLQLKLHRGTSPIRKRPPP